MRPTWGIAIVLSSVWIGALAFAPQRAVANSSGEIIVAGCPDCAGSPMSTPENSQPAEPNSDFFDAIERSESPSDAASTMDNAQPPPPDADGTADGAAAGDGPVDPPAAAAASPNQPQR